MSDVAAMFSNMGDHSGQITVVLAIIAVTILGRAILSGLLDKNDSDSDDV